MKSIWKYQIKITDEQIIEVPFGSEFLHIGIQKDIPTIWFIVDTTRQEKETIKLRIYGTGHKIPDWISKDEHIGTIKMSNDSLIWHVFRVQWNV